jgi:acyl-CoA synthetase (AMP-forming)/AMP-acid ligase II/acyl carrier protein
MSRSSSLHTLVDLLQTQASELGDRIAFRFLVDQSGDEICLSFQQLHERAMAIGAELQSMAAQGERALLIFPPGLEFITAFFGCLYAGIAAVPAAPPSRNRLTSSVEAIFQASKPALVLSTSGHHKLAEQAYSHLSELFERPWIATDHVADERQHLWHQPSLSGGQTAFLQYTSGSTSSPKGVVISHENLLYNAGLIQQAFGNTRQSSAVCWLPLYHDMGLIGGVIQPIFCGGTCTLLAPASFLQRPALWLETISRMQASVCGGPDFAYDLCVRKISPEEREGLDLSSWEVAFTGAERIRAETIERFCETFAPCGFRREAFFPCYGLAEATLMVSGGPRLTPPVILRLQTDALQQNRAQEASDADTNVRTLVACGQSMLGQKIHIVNPQTRLDCADGEIGEIWVQGSSVAEGYFQRPEATDSTFGGRLADTGEGPFLRTGDLGFLRNSQLFVTGRLKDVIIIRGRNYYPEDIERSVERAHPAFRPGFCAAFSIEADNRDRLVVVQEIEPRQRDVDADEAFWAIRRVVAAEHDLEVYAIVLAKAGDIPKTSSGKTRRSGCRDRYLDGQIKIIAQWATSLGTADDVIEPIAASSRSVSASEIESWLARRIATRLHLPLEQVYVATPFLEFGMGSVDAVEIAAELEQWLGRRMSPTAIYNYPNIAALAEWLSALPLEDEPTAPQRQASLPVEEFDAERILDDVRRMTEDELQTFIMQEMEKQ